MNTFLKRQEDESAALLVPYAHTVCPYSICCYRDQSIVRNDRDKARILRIRFPFI